MWHEVSAVRLPSVVSAGPPGEVPLWAAISEKSSIGLHIRRSKWTMAEKHLLKRNDVCLGK
jgi:hypothetical protein